MSSLKHVLEIIAQYNNGSLSLSEEVSNCQRLLRESEVLGELENGNLYVIKYVGDGKLHVVRNYNRGSLTYWCEYEEYLSNLPEDPNNVW